MLRLSTMTVLCVTVGVLILQQILADGGARGHTRNTPRRRNPETGEGRMADGMPHLDRRPSIPDYTCKQRNKCSKREGVQMGFYDQNCFCDDLCRMYGDCCKDYKGSLPDTIPAHFRLSKRTLSCHRVIPIDQTAEIYRVEKCPTGYGDAFVREKCEDSHSLDQFLEIPVSGLQTGILYKNYYCAVCSGDVNLSFWNVKWICENGPSIDNVTNTEQLLDDVWFMGAGNCIYEFTHPTMTYRRCKSHLSRCPKYWDGDPEVSRKCKETTAYTYVDSSMDFMVFGNVYCARCYDINATYLTCRDPRGVGMRHRPPEPPSSSSFSILLDIPTGTGRIQIRNKDNPDAALFERTVTFRQCGEDHVYDPFNKVCRRISCPNEMVFAQGDCISEEEQQQRMAATKQAAGKTTTATAITTTTRRIQPRTKEVTKPSGSTSGPQIFTPPSGAIPGSRDVDTAKPAYEAVPSSDSKTRTGIDLDCPMRTFNISQYTTLQNSSVYVLAIQRMFDVGSYILDGSMLYVCAVAIDGGTDPNLARDDRKALMFQYDRIQSLVSFIGILISLIALLICLLAHIILPQIRTVHGKCIIGLSVSLFLAQALYLAGNIGIGHPVACRVVGIAMHYTLVAAFCWTNCLAVDICKAFANCNRSNDEARSSSYIHHSLYAWLFPACLVALCVTLDMVDFSRLGIEPELDLYRPYYGDGLCWVTGKNALIYLVAVPLGLLLIIDIFTYIVAIKNMYSVAAVGKAAARRDKDKNRFLLYIKLSFIMAMAWTFGLLATFTRLRVLWYLFIVFNSLQGAYVCFAFVCTRKVFRLLRSTGRVHRSASASNSRPYHRAYSNASSNNPWGYTRSNFLYEDMETNSKIIAQETSI
ncbi:hypothetical protein LSH36_165g08007 [Paralvinella palmiformis]|uniref:Uncharacterized protein n=1 Tax=Paralvinella palmiformis TaxID=53620 RepID=A0AAD9JTM6_9ANNE|nr:hypothetical protein LSH36_165g08007 [Paralvinella palmiformis]